MKHKDLVKKIFSYAEKLEKSKGVETIMIIDEMDSFINNYIFVELERQIFNDPEIVRVSEKVKQTP